MKKSGRPLSHRRPIPCPNHGRYTTSSPEWCWGCYENRKGKNNHKGHIGYRAPRKAFQGFEESFVRRPAERTDEARSIQLDHALDGFFAELPHIAAVLFDDKWDDGKERKLGSLSIALYQGNLRLALNDPAQGRSLYTVCDSVPEGLDLMEAAIKDDSARWYIWPKANKKK